MKTMISLMAWMAVACAYAQEQAPGFLRLVNAVAVGEGNLTLRIDGENYYPKGYATGQASGGIGLPAGRHRIELSMAGIAGANHTLDLQAGTTVTLVAAAEATDPLQQHWRLVMKPLSAVASSHYELRCVSLCRVDELMVTAAMEGKKAAEPLRLRRWAAESIRLGKHRGRAVVRIGPQSATLDLDDPGCYTLVIYQTVGGEVRWISYFDPVLENAG